ncbi:MAG: hypothetical protein Q9219_006450 [cf. Caloplaca sp. 3 TL-2023]
MSFLRANSVILGKWQQAVYTAIRPIREGCPTVWLAQSNDQKEVVLKEAYDDRSFEAEANALNGYLRGHPSFRQLVDLVPEQKILVLEHLSDNLRHVIYTRPERKLEEPEMKKVTKVILNGLITMHQKGFAHTDIKPENIVVDVDQNKNIGRIALIDLAESITIEPTTDHPYSHAIYRAPEGLFGLPWTTKVDIWSLGTLIMEGLSGAKFFSALGIKEDEDIYDTIIFMLQSAYFGPFPTSYMELSDQMDMEVLDAIEGLVTQKGGRRRYRNTLAYRFTQQTVDFLHRVMRLDPRDRPSAEEILYDPGLSNITD